MENMRNLAETAKELLEKPASFLELDFGSKSNATKAYKLITQKIDPNEKLFNTISQEGSTIYFEELDDADELMNELNRYKIKFKVTASDRRR